ncbi:sulfur carrier protein ThiS [Blautia schinkii]|nr:sulfur carrier protein ThiS [Blautia schinkii]
MLIVNGKEMQYSGPCTVLELLGRLGYRPDRTAVEKNGEIIPRAELAGTELADNDKLEIVSFVGGG